MADNGWISLHRKIGSHWLWEAKPFSYGQAWITILLECNHSERKVNLGNYIYTVKRGESLNSLDTWAKLFGWNKSKVRRFFELLKSDSMIVTKPTHNTTHLIVTNYSTYQNTRHEDETKVKQSWHKVDTKLTPNNNVNNENNDNNSVSSAHAAFHSISSKKPSRHDIMRITQLCHDYTVEAVVVAIGVCGDHGWHSVNTLLKVLKGELPKKEKQTIKFNKDALV